MVQDPSRQVGSGRRRPFVLVHGSGQDASGWARVAALLEERGHAVTTPQLPRSAPEWKLEDYAAEIARAVKEPEAIVVAHSQSGSFLPLVPEFTDCAGLVFLAALIPEPGKSAREQFEADPWMFDPRWIEAGARALDPAHRERIAREFLFHDCDEETFAWALTTVDVMDAHQTVPQPCPLERWPDLPCASIVATRDRTISPAWIRSAGLRAMGRTGRELIAGHCPHVSRPGEVVRELVQFADFGSEVGGRTWSERYAPPPPPLPAATGREHIDLTEIRTKEELHELFERRFAFPGFYGRNWQAFLDCVTHRDMSVMPAVIAIAGWDEFERRLPTQATALLQCLGDLVYERADVRVEWVDAGS